MEFIHKKKAEVQRMKMLSDQAVARREHTKEKRLRREQRIAQKRAELLGKQQLEDDTNVAVQQAIEQQAQSAVITPISQSQQPAPAKARAKEERKQRQQPQTQAQPKKK